MNNNNIVLKMSTLFEDIIDVTDELIELMKQDWENVKKFFKEYKTYIYWFVVLTITLQFTDLMSLGASWEKYCKKNNIKMSGGGGPGESGNDPATTPAQTTGNAGKNATASASAATPAQTTGNAGKNASASASTETKPAAKSDLNFDKDLIKQFSGKSADTKQVDKQLGFFKRMKEKISGVSAGRYGLAGPVFGSLDRITTYLQGLVSIFTLIMVILGVISIPVFIFLVITYTVFKVIINKVFIL